jgi:hypothetical protein
MRGPQLLAAVSLAACAPTPRQAVQRECEQEVAAQMGYPVNANGTWSPPEGEVKGGGRSTGQG